MNAQAATIRQLRGKLGALTKQMNDDREFGYKQLAIESDMKKREIDLINMLIIALLTMDSSVPHEVVYFTKTQLADKLLALYPAVAGRLGREPQVQR